MGFVALLIFHFHVINCLLMHAESIGYGDPLMAVLPSFHGIH